MFHFKILYVHGLGSSSQSSTAQQLKTHLPSVLDDSFELFSPDIPELPSIAIPFIESFVHNNSIDLVIGSSLGGFKVLNSKFSTHVNVLVINPVIDFNATQIETSQSLVELYNEGITIFEKYKANHLIHPQSKKKVVFIGLSDEVLDSNKQLEALNAYYLSNGTNSELIELPNEGHKLSEDTIRLVVCPVIATILL